ncbi:E3 ubiquitin-protein ligase TRIM56, partial [Huso huso]
KCKICFELYKSPRILPCLHSYCEQCLEKLLEKGKGTIYCPECRTETCVQGSVRNIKTNFFINGLLDLFESKRKKEAFCSVCVSLKQSPEAASSRCLDCADFLCRACAEGHRCSKLTLSHTVVSLQDYTAGRYDEEARLRQEQHCHSHQDTLRFYCNTCSTPICRDCRMLEHFSHHILVMADAVKARKPQVEGLISSLDNNIKSIGQQEEAVDSMIGQLKESQSTIQDCVSKYISVLVELLYAQRDSICKELSDFVQQQEKSYLSIKQALHNHMDSAQSTKDFSRKVMEMGKDYEILQLEGTIQSHIKRLQDLNIPAAEGKMPHLVIKEGLNKESVGKQMFQLRFEPHCNSSGNAPTVVATDIKLEPHMTVQKSVETSVQKSVETPVQKSETPVQKSVEAPVQKSVNAPVQKSVNAPVQKSETPVQKSETPVQKSVEAAVQKSVEAPVHKSVNAPVHKSETPVQKSVETPVQKSVEAAVQKSVEAPVHKSVNAAVQKSETPVQKSVEAPVQKSVNAPVQKSETPVQKSETPVQKSVKAAVQKFVEAPVQKSVNAPVQKSVNAPVQKSVNAPVQKSETPVQKSETSVKTTSKSDKTMVQKMVKIAFVCAFQIVSCDNEFTPVISGLSHFENGDIIIADYKNSVIKRFDIKGKYSISTSLMNIHLVVLLSVEEMSFFTSKAFFIIPKENILIYIVFPCVAHIACMQLLLTRGSTEQ